MRKLRVTFINFRRKLEGGLAEEVDEQMPSSVESSAMSASSFHSINSRASRISGASKKSKISRVSNKSKVSPNQKLKSKKTFNNYEDLEDAINGEEKKREEIKRMRGRTTKADMVKKKFKEIIGSQNNLDLPRAETLDPSANSLQIPKAGLTRRNSNSGKLASIELASSVGKPHKRNSVRLS